MSTRGRQGSCGGQEAGCLLACRNETNTQLIGQPCSALGAARSLLPLPDAARVVPHPWGTQTVTPNRAAMVSGHEMGVETSSVNH